MPHRLSRRAGDGRPAPPVRLVHLGLGNFFRAHQAWYTEFSRDAGEWGMVAFAGRSAGPAHDLDAQGGLYTLVTRGPETDHFEVISSLCRAHAAADVDQWLGRCADPAVAAVTVTITEAGYHRSGDGGLDRRDAAVAGDLARLAQGADAEVETGPGRLVAGLAARRHADAGPLALVPCDNVPGNAQMLRRVVMDMAEPVDAALAAWIDQHIEVVGTVVDRITPGAQPSDLDLVASATSYRDAVPVVAEPYAEWVLSGRFPAGRPAWESAGARFAGDLVPYEQRKLWLLNGAHSLLAYAGSIRGHRTVFEAVHDDACRLWTEQWWTEASLHLGQPADVLASYRSELLRRFANGRMHDQLSRIAEDGSQKLPIRVVPVLRAERQAQRLPVGAATVVAAWVCHLRGLGVAVRDARADDVVPLAAGPLGPAVRAVLGWLHPDLADDAALARLVEDRATMLAE